jgi:hypothetical protein
MSAAIDEHVGYMGMIMHCEPYQTVYIDKIFHEIADKDEYWLESEGITQTDIVEEKERVLKYNLGSFVCR